VCFQRQLEAQCDAVAPRPCAVYVASDSGAVCRPPDFDGDPDPDPVSAAELRAVAHAASKRAHADCPAAKDREVPTAPVVASTVLSVRAAATGKQHVSRLNVALRPALTGAAVSVQAVSNLTRSLSARNISVVVSEGEALHIDQIDATQVPDVAGAAAKIYLDWYMLTQVRCGPAVPLSAT